MNSNKLKLGWVGSGFIGQVAHLSNYIEIPNVEILALAELRPKLGDIACKKYGIPRYYKDHKALLEDPDIEAIVAIVRRQHTAFVALEILNKGFHLFTEKPMAPTVDQGQMLVNAAVKNNCIYVTGYMRRHDEGVQLAKQKFNDLIESGELGDMLYFRAYSFGGNDYCNINSGYTGSDEPPPNHYIWPIAPDWVPKELENDYERFNNISIHNVNLIRYFFEATPKITHVDYFGDSGTITLNYGKFKGVFEFAYLQTDKFWEEGIEIYFTYGCLKLKLPPAFLKNQAATVSVYKDKKNEPMESINTKPNWTWSFKRQAESFIKTVLTANESIASGAGGLEDLRFIEDVWRHIVR